MQAFVVLADGASAEVQDFAEWVRNLEFDRDGVLLNTDEMTFAELAELALDADPDIVEVSLVDGAETLLTFEQSSTLPEGWG